MEEAIAGQSVDPRPKSSRPPMLASLGRVVIALALLAGLLLGIASAFGASNLSARDTSGAGVWLVRVLAIAVICSVAVVVWRLVRDNRYWKAFGVFLGLAAALLVVVQAVTPRHAQIIFVGTSPNDLTATCSGRAPCLDAAGRWLPSGVALPGSTSGFELRGGQFVASSRGFTHAEFHYLDRTSGRPFDYSVSFVPGKDHQAPCRETTNGENVPLRSATGRILCYGHGYGRHSVGLWGAPMNYQISTPGPFGTASPALERWLVGVADRIGMTASCQARCA
jgi:hypothetical protein